MRRTVVIIVSVLLSSSLIYGCFFSTWAEIDTCLDLGGGWHEELGCVGGKIGKPVPPGWSDPARPDLVPDPEPSPNKSQ